jgi:SGNH domain-containing protein
LSILLRRSLALAAAAIVLGAVALLVFVRLGGVQPSVAKQIILPDGTVHDAQQIRKTRSRARECGPKTQNPTCLFGAKESPRRAFLFGDSHAAQWFPAVEAFAEANEVALYARLMPACLVAPISFLRPTTPLHVDCRQWSEEVVGEIERIKPEFVLIGQASRYEPTRTDSNEKLERQERAEALASAEHALIERIRATGAQVIMIVDTPRLPIDPLRCLMQNRGHTGDCRWPERELVSGDRFPWSLKHNEGRPGVGLLDLTDQLCWEGFCHAANDTQVIMRDEGHVTTSFALSVYKTLAERLTSALD